MCNFKERTKTMNELNLLPGMTLELEKNDSPTSNSKPDPDGHVVFTVHGSFDREHTPYVFEGITPLFNEGNKGVTMNLEGVTRIDNSGIATIVECVRMASDSETEFHVVGINSNVKEVLELSKLSALFENMEFSTFCSSDKPGTLGCHIKKKTYTPNHSLETN